MIDEKTNWPRLYAIAVLIGAGFGLLLSLDALPSAPDWPTGWGAAARVGAVGRILVPVLGGAVIGVLLAGAAHLGVRYQLRRRS